jgi:transposase
MSRSTTFWTSTARDFVPTLGPPYRLRRRLTIAVEKLDEAATARVVGLLAAGDPHGEVATAWEGKEAVRMLYDHRDPELALECVDALSADLSRPGRPAEVRKMGRALTRWPGQFTAWHQAGDTNGPTESMNNMAKWIKRVAFAMTSFRSWRIRVPLYAGRPDSNLLETITPLPW